MRSTPIIDAWIQHPSPRMLQHAMFQTLVRWMKMEDIPESVPIELTVEALDTAGISQAMVCAWSSPQGFMITNDEVAQFVEAAPDKLVGVAAVDISKPMEAVRELRRCVKEMGFKGLRILPWLWQLPPNDRRYYPLYVECIELGIPFCLQVGHAGPLMPSEPGRPMPYLDQVACDFPELVIVGGHIGYPWTEEMIAMARKYPNVYIDTSAYRPKRYPETLVDYMKGGGRNKVLFGSNYPMLMPSMCIDGVSELGLDEEATELFLSGNAKRVFSL